VCALWCGGARYYGLRFRAGRGWVRNCKLLKGEVLANIRRYNSGNIHPIYCIYCSYGRSAAPEIMS
jgi:hypothetical protein